MKLNKWGILNIILVLIIGVGLLFLFTNVAEQKDEFIEVEVTGDGSVPSWLIDSINVGDKETTTIGKNIAEVVNKISYDEGTNKVFFLKLKLAVTKDTNKVSYRYKQKLLEIGSLIDFSLGNSRIKAYVTSIGNVESDQELYKIVKVKLFYRRPYYADKIKIGDKVIELSSNKLQSEILSKKVELAETTSKTINGDLVTKYDPLFRDIILDMRLRVMIRGGLDYFANYQPLKIGNQIWIPMNDYNLYDGEVLDVKNDSRD